MERKVNRPRLGWSPGNAPTAVLHRSGITSADKLATPAAPTLAAVTEAGSTLANLAYNVSVSAGNRWGSTPGGATAANTPTASQAVRATIAQITNAEFYDIFLSTAANPLWVGRITEAQRAAGGFIISTVGSVTAGGGAGAGAVDLGIVGTGPANNAAPYTLNNAVVPNAGSITPINCQDYEYADVMVKMAVTDFRVLPTLILTGFQQVGSSPGDWCQFWTQTVTLLTAVQQPLEQMFRVAVGGAFNVVFLVESIAGQGAAASISVDLE